MTNSELDQALGFAKTLMYDEFLLALAEEDEEEQNFWADGLKFFRESYPTEDESYKSEADSAIRELILQYANIYGPKEKRPDSESEKATRLQLLSTALNHVLGITL